MGTVLAAYAATWVYLSLRIDAMRQVERKRPGVERATDRPVRGGVDGQSDDRRALETERLVRVAEDNDEKGSPIRQHPPALRRLFGGTPEDMSGDWRTARTVPIATIDPTFFARNLNVRPIVPSAAG
jgi:hypothetical protein